MNKIDIIPHTTNQRTMDTNGAATMISSCKISACSIELIRSTYSSDCLCSKAFTVVHQLLNLQTKKEKRAAQTREIEAGERIIFHKIVHIASTNTDNRLLQSLFFRKNIQSVDLANKVI